MKLSPSDVHFKDHIATVCSLIIGKEIKLVFTHDSDEKRRRIELVVVV